MERKGRGLGGELAKEQGLRDVISRAQAEKGWFRRKNRKKKFFFQTRWKVKRIEHYFKWELNSFFEV